MGKNVCPIPTINICIYIFFKNGPPHPYVFCGLFPKQTHEKNQMDLGNVGVRCVRLKFLYIYLCVTSIRCLRATCGEFSVPHVCADATIFSPRPGAAGGRVPDAAETEGTASPHTDRSARLHPELTHDRPVARPSVLGHSLTPAGRPGMQPLRPAGQCTAQAGGRSLHRVSRHTCICWESQITKVSGCVTFFFFPGYRREGRRQEWVRFVSRRSSLHEEIGRHGLLGRSVVHVHDF